MDYEHIAHLVMPRDVEIIAIAEAVGEADQRVIKLYREYLLVRTLAYRDRNNEPLHSYLHKIYWEMMREIKAVELITEILGFKILTITEDLSVRQHNH